MRWRVWQRIALTCSAQMQTFICATPRRFVTNRHNARTSHRAVAGEERAVTQPV